MADWSQTWTFFDGEWRGGQTSRCGGRAPMPSGWAPPCGTVRASSRVRRLDLDLHCARVKASAKTHVSQAHRRQEEWIGLTREGMKKFPVETTLYVRPDVLGGSGRSHGVARRSEVDPLCAHALRLADAQARRILDHAVARSSARPSNAPRSKPRPDVFIRTTRGRCSRRSRAASTIARLRHAGGMSPSLPTPTCSWERTAVVFTPMPNGTFPQRHYPPARNQADARSRDIGG